MLRSDENSISSVLPVNGGSFAGTDAGTYISDIDERLAYDAHQGTSWVPERRAVTTRQEYANSLASIYASLLKHADSEEKRARLDIEFARFREGYARRYKAYLMSRSRIVSSFIAGPSNFPVRRMEKRNHVAHRRLDEFLDFQKRAKETILRALHPEWRPIMSGDADACERLQAKIEAAEALQMRMKAANAAIRKTMKDGPEAQVRALVAIGFSEMQSQKLLQPDFCGRIGFADFELTNNNANLRRMKARLEQISQAQQKEVTETRGSLARIEDDPPANRVRLFFPGKPDAGVRETLKGSGFRWAPSIGAWQAYRNHSTLSAASRFAGVASVVGTAN